MRSFEHFLDDEAHVLRQHRRAAAEDAADARLIDIDLLRERFEQLRRGEQAADLAVLQDRRRLIHDVLHVRLAHVELLVARSASSPSADRDR